MPSPYDPTKPYIPEIIEAIKPTWETTWASLKHGALWLKYMYPMSPPHMDGTGSKGVYCWREKALACLLKDAFAMNYNDLLLERAIPIVLTDYISIPQDVHNVFVNVMKLLAGECLKREIILSGGEFAIDNTKEGMEIVINMLGFTPSRKANVCEVGDFLIGIRSNGLHCNGFSAIRKLFPETRPEFLEPTYIYDDILLPLWKKKNFLWRERIWLMAWRILPAALSPS